MIIQVQNDQWGYTEKLAIWSIENIIILIVKIKLKKTTNYNVIQDSPLPCTVVLRFTFDTSKIGAPQKGSISENNSRKKLWNK